jgi:hypothetical protein
MSSSKPFHGAVPTGIDDEIRLAEALYSAGIIRHGKDGFRARMRTDPGAYFAGCHYVRLLDRRGSQTDCIIAAGFKGDDSWLGYPTKASVENILTPSHEAYREFSERLLSLLVSDDFAWNYAPAAGEYWPLGSAEIIRDMGFAVAETLTLYQAFLGDTDRRIYDHVEGFWRTTKPRKGRVPFDAPPKV